MPFQKGNKLSPGRPVGSKDKATSLAREAIARFVDGNAERLAGWLDAIAAKDQKQAFDCFMSVVEYHVPKLARIETKTEINGNIIVEVVKFSQKV